MQFGENPIKFHVLKQATVEMAQRLKIRYFDLNGMLSGRDYLITDMNYNPVENLETHRRPVIVWEADEP